MLRNEAKWYENITASGIMNLMVDLHLVHSIVNETPTPTLPQLLTHLSSLNLSKAHTELLKTVLLILDRLLPNQTWTFKLKFLKMVERNLT